MTKWMTVAAVVMLAQSAEAQTRSRWGVSGGFTPSWQFLPQVADLIDRDVSISGREFEIGIVRGRDLSGDWGISFVRKNVKDGYRAALQRGDASAPESVSLFEAILGPIARRLDGATRLVVCADGPLMRLPFAALSERAGAPLLFERMTVPNSPSCLPQLPSTPPRRGRDTRVLIAGDPDRPGVARLPRAREEAVAVAALYPGATVTLGQDVTRARLRSLLPRAGMFHFAGHAVAHPTRPSLSRLMLAPSDGDVDGALYASEIEAMTLSARLVILAACDTAAGVSRAGAGVLGLAEAFLSAGVQAVVATQWPVADAEAAPFFVELHRQLAGGVEVPAALRAAQAWARGKGLSAALWSAVIAIAAPVQTSNTTS